MNYNEEAKYIEAIDFTNPGNAYLHDPKIFAKYCEMQRNGARRDKNWEASDRIGVVIANLQDQILRNAVIDYMVWNDSNSDIGDFRDNHAEMPTVDLIAGLHADLYEK